MRVAKSPISLSCSGESPSCQSVSLCQSVRRLSQSHTPTPVGAWNTPRDPFRSSLFRALGNHHSFFNPSSPPLITHYYSDQQSKQHSRARAFVHLTSMIAMITARQERNFIFRIATAFLFGDLLAYSNHHQREWTSSTGPDHVGDRFCILIRMRVRFQPLTNRINFDYPSHSPLNSLSHPISSSSLSAFLN